MILDDILNNYAQRLVEGQGKSMMAAEGMKYNKGGYYEDLYTGFDDSKSLGEQEAQIIEEEKRRRREKEVKNPNLSQSTFAFNKPIDREVKGDTVSSLQSMPSLSQSDKPIASSVSSSGSGSGFRGGSGDGTRGGGFFYDNESFNSYLNDIYSMNANSDMVMERGGKYTYVNGGKF